MATLAIPHSNKGSTHTFLLEDADTRPRKRLAWSFGGGDGGVRGLSTGQGEQGGGDGGVGPPSRRLAALNTSMLRSARDLAIHALQTREAARKAALQQALDLTEDSGALPSYATWQWYRNVVQGVALRSAGFFPCSHPRCTSSALIHLPPPPTQGSWEGGGDGGRRSSEAGASSCRMCKAAGMCKQCGTRLCGVCSFKAQRAVPFHPPLPCDHRVLVEACVSRVEEAMEAADAKYNAAVATSRASLFARPAGGGGRKVVDAGAGSNTEAWTHGQGSQGKQPSAHEIAGVVPGLAVVPRLAELIELLSQLGRTEEVETLRLVQAGTYQPPPVTAKELSSVEVISRSSKPCPTGCGWDITKDRGCNHMTCKKCAHKFCWRCLQVFASLKIRFNKYMYMYVQSF